MARVSNEDVSLTMTDGYVMKFHYYYDEAVTPATDKPIVVTVHGSGGNKDNGETVAKDLADNGFIGVTFDGRGCGDGRTDNAASPELGRRSVSEREVLDLFELIEEVQSLNSSRVDTDQTGVLGTSWGGAVTWGAMAMSGRFPSGSMRKWRANPLPKIRAVSPTAAEADLFSAVIMDGDGLYEGVFSTFVDQSAEIMHNPTYRAARQAALKAGTEAYRAFLAGGSPGGVNTDLPSRAMLFQGLNKHTHVLCFKDWDDNAHKANFSLYQTYRHTGDMDGGADDRAKHVLVLGAFGHHRATAVASEITDMDAKRIAFFKSVLLDDESDIAANFGPGAPATFDDVAEVHLSITPNNDADYILEDATPGGGGGYADETYSRKLCYVNDTSFFQLAWRDTINSTAQMLYLDTGPVLTAALTPTAVSGYTSTYDQTWTTPTTLENYADAKGNNRNLWTYVDERTSKDNVDFDKSWAAPWSAIIAGVPKLVLYASSDTPGAVINAELRYIDTGAGEDTFVTSGYTRFGDQQHYQPGSVKRFEIYMDAVAMHLDGNSNAKLRLRINNLAHRSNPYDGYVGGMRIHPGFDDSTVTIHYGNTYTSRIYLPLHDEDLTTLA